MRTLMIGSLLMGNCRMKFVVQFFFIYTLSCRFLIDVTPL
jgi:hypothetical protein